MCPNYQNLLNFEDICFMNARLELMFWRTWVVQWFALSYHIKGDLSWAVWSFFGSYNNQSNFLVLKKKKSVFHNKMFYSQSLWAKWEQHRLASQAQLLLLCAYMHASVLIIHYVRKIMLGTLVSFPPQTCRKTTECAYCHKTVVVSTTIMERDQKGKVQLYCSVVCVEQSRPPQHNLTGMTHTRPHVSGSCHKHRVYSSIFITN